MAKSIIWSDDYKLGIEIIDSQHKQFVEIIDELYRSIQNLTSERELEGVLDKLVNYHTLHFATEERYFEEFNYEGTEEHKAAHHAFNQKISDFQKQAKEGTHDIGFDLIDYLEDWLVNHLATMDKKYVACFHEHGLK